MTPETALEQAAAMAERIPGHIEHRAFTGNILLTATFGVSSCEPHWTAHELLESADRALYLGNSAGRNRAVHDRFKAGRTPAAGPASEPP